MMSAPTAMFAIGSTPSDRSRHHISSGRTQGDKPSVVILLLDARRTKQLGPIFAARDLVTDWINRSYFQTDPDKKFAWYDHGTAERQLALIIMWHLGHEQGFDIRFMERLKLVIFRQGQLLASELFYASHQPTRYHNHAWFQDIALLATALSMCDFPCAATWQRIAIERLEDQLEHLIVRDNGYAVFIENSIGYHQGVQELVEFAGTLASLSGCESPIPAVATELSRFSELLRYPDSRAPSFGDTFRRSNASTASPTKRRDASTNGLSVLPKAGYAIVKGHHEHSGYILTVIATSLNRTHKHEDNLSFSLYFDGIEWLIDPSFFSHEYAAPIPAYLRSAAAHNALVVPGREYSIAPGIARIDGQELPGSRFHIAGEHRAFAGIVVKRTFAGRLDALEFSVDDLALEEAGIPQAHEGPCLMFHCGEGVRASVSGSVVSLSHPISHYKIAIQLPNEAIRVAFGQKDASRVRGVAGLGFMQLSDIVTIESEVAFGETHRWRLQAVKGAYRD